MSLTSSSRNLLNAFVSGKLVQRCIIHSRFDGPHTTLLTRSLYVTSQVRASTNKMVFWWVVQKHTDCVPAAMAHYLGRRVQNLGNPIFTTGFLSLNATNNSWRLHRTNGFCFWSPFCIALPFFWEVCANIPFLCLSSLADRVKYFKTLKYSEH